MSHDQDVLTKESVDALKIQSDELIELLKQEAQELYLSFGADNDFIDEQCSVIGNVYFFTDETLDDYHWLVSFISKDNFDDPKKGLNHHFICDELYANQNISQIESDEDREFALSFVYEYNMTYEEAFRQFEASKELDAMIASSVDPQELNTYEFLRFVFTYDAWNILAELKSYHSFVKLSRVSDTVKALAIDLLKRIPEEHKNKKYSWVITEMGYFNGILKLCTKSIPSKVYKAVDLTKLQ